jgi:hypothetical protein
VSFTKLFPEILTSTIWQEPNDCKVLWFAILALKGPDQICRATIPALAQIASISIDDCKRYMTKFQEPDEYSRSQEHEGRRLEQVEGGYLVLNGERYQYERSRLERKEYIRQKVSEHRARNSHVNKRKQMKTTVNNVNSCKPTIDHRPKTKTKTQKETCGLEPNPTVETHVEPSETEGPSLPVCPDLVLEIFGYWRTATGHTQAKLTPKRKQKITARLREGYTLEQIQEAIEGCKASPFHMGENERGTVFDDLELILRDGGKLEQFRNYKLGGVNGEIIRRHGPRMESRGERIDRETREYFEALTTDPLDTAKQILPRLIGPGTERGN